MPSLGLKILLLFILKLQHHYKRLMYHHAMRRKKILLRNGTYRIFCCHACRHACRHVCHHALCCHVCHLGHACHLFPCYLGLGLLNQLKKVCFGFIVVFALSPFSKRAVIVTGFAPENGNLLSPKVNCIPKTCPCNKQIFFSSAEIFSSEKKKKKKKKKNIYLYYFCSKHWL